MKNTLVVSDSSWQNGIVIKPAAASGGRKPAHLPAVNDKPFLGWKVTLGELRKTVAVAYQRKTGMVASHAVVDQILLALAEGATADSVRVHREKKTITGVAHVVKRSRDNATVDIASEQYSGRAYMNVPKALRRRMKADGIYEVSGSYYLDTSGVARLSGVTLKRA